MFLSYSLLYPTQSIMIQYVIKHLKLWNANKSINVFVHNNNIDVNFMFASLYKISLATELILIFLSPAQSHIFHNCRKLHFIPILLQVKYLREVCRGKRVVFN